MPDIDTAWVFPLTQLTICKNPLYLSSDHQVHLTSRSVGYDLRGHLNLWNGLVISQGPYSLMPYSEGTFALPVDIFIQAGLENYVAAQIKIARWWKNLYYRPDGKHYHQTMTRVKEQYYHKVVTSTT